MNDRLQQLALFVRTVETGGFSRAARDFGLTQPSASRAVAALEERLGVKLIARTTRDAGEALLASARDALAAVEDAENAARGADRLSGVLRVALPTTYGARRIAPLLSRSEPKSRAVDPYQCARASDSATLAGSDAGRAPRLTARAEGLGPKTPPRPDALCPWRARYEAADHNSLGWRRSRARPVPRSNGRPLEDFDAAYQHGDFAAAVQLLRPLADQGNALAQTSLGIMHAQGQGIPQTTCRPSSGFARRPTKGTPPRRTLSA